LARAAAQASAAATNAAGSYLTVNAVGKLHAAGCLGGAGIGGGSGAAGSFITISGGAVEATCSQRPGAGVGGGQGGNGTDITLSGGTLLAVGGTYNKNNSGGAGVGGGQGGTGAHITFSGCAVSVLGGSNAAGVGGGSNSGPASGITISAGSLTASGSIGGAGIGGGNGGSGANIAISGGTVVAKGGADGGAGIGGGNIGNADGIRISGGDIEASGSMASGGIFGSSSAGIGGGGYGSASNIVITGGKVHAYIKKDAYCFSTYDPIAIGRGSGGGTSTNITVSTGENRYALITIANSAVPRVGSQLPVQYEDSVKECGDIALLEMENPLLSVKYFKTYSNGKFGQYLRDVTIEFADCKDSSGTAHTHSYVYSQSYSSTLDGVEHTTPDYHYQYCTVCGAVKAGTLQQHTYAWNTATHQKVCTSCGRVSFTDIYPPVIQHIFRSESAPADPDQPVYGGGGTEEVKTEPIETGASFYMENATDLFTFNIQEGTSKLVSVEVDNTAVTANANGEYSISPDNEQHTITAVSESGLTTSVTIGVYRKYEVKIIDTTNPDVTLQSFEIGYGQPCPFTFTQPANTTYVKVEVVYDEEDHKGLQYDAALQ
jgi:hypothetical protein